MIRRLSIILVVLILTAAAFTRGATTGDLVEVRLNGLTITIDKQTGSILGLDYSGPGKMLSAGPDIAGIVDLAYPIPEFAPLRLASRYSKGAQIEKSENAVVISWENLGASRTYFQPAGKISARVSLTAMPDGSSISIKCQIVNATERPIGQVLFPDFHGLLPFAGPEETYLRTAGFARKPFIDVGPTVYPEFYAVEGRGERRDTQAFTGGTNYGSADNMIGRWLDFGGLSGGISLFPKLWAGAPATKVRIIRLEKDPNIRLFYEHDLTIKPGETWESPEYVLTPHRQGWAKGIEPYRDFVRSNIKRQFPVPKHVREGLGYRTIWMSKGFPADGERDVAFKAADLPKVAMEAKVHGLDELNVWFSMEPFQLPIPPPYRHLGTSEEFADAIKECNKIGVNVALFISVISIADPTASRYGLKLASGWTYHTELVPRFNPPYANFRGTRVIASTDQAYPVWRKEVLESVRNIYARYTHSISWDQANAGTEELFREFLPWVKERDPRATFSGEITSSAERSAAYLDYTWNWESGSYHHNLNAPYRDDRAFIASFPSPRLNKGINRNAQHIKYYFMDNGYLNVMPSAPDDANGTAWLKDYPEVSQVLKQCASLRSQFLQYFTEGTLIGECLLQQTCAGAHVDAYVLPDKVLFIIMNTQAQPRPLTFTVDLEPWLKSNTGRYEIRWYDQYGKSLGVRSSKTGAWTGKTPVMKPYELAIFEFTAR